MSDTARSQRPPAAARTQPTEAATDERPDWFAPPGDDTDAILWRVKGQARRGWIRQALARGEPVRAIPADIRAQGVPDHLKATLQRWDPRFQGGEDLPDLTKGEVEIARIVLVDSVHGEVVSVRAHPGRRGRIALRIVDEYGTAIAPPAAEVDLPFTAEELIRWLEASDPTPLHAMCQLRLESPFYDGLDELADRLSVKRLLDPNHPCARPPTSSMPA